MLAHAATHTSETPFMRTLLFASLLTIGMGSAPGLLNAAPCTGFKWDVSKEVALYAGHGATLTAGKDANSAPVIAIDHLYQLQLVPQTDVTFAVAPGKKMLTDGAFAGLALLKLDSPGNYRVAVDAPFWIDLVANGKLAVTRDFQGQQSCDGPHKIVEFDLGDAKQFVLQVSAAAAATVRLTVTQAPAQTPVAKP
jgi:hypothetical protein